MPANWDWTYQLNEWAFLDDVNPTQNKLMAWGLMGGSVGQVQYDGYGYEHKYAGYPYQSYSVHGVFGRHSSGEVMRQVNQVETQLASTLTVTTGRIVSQGPGGVGRTDSVAYDVPGYNQMYGAYELEADTDGTFGLTLDAGIGSIINPIFIVRGAAGLPGQVLLDQAVQFGDRGYFASYDASTRTLWLTINAAWTGSRTLSGAP
jgi:hypothetical protein